MGRAGAQDDHGQEKPVGDDSLEVQGRILCPLLPQAGLQLLAETAVLLSAKWSEHKAKAGWLKEGR